MVKTKKVKLNSAEFNIREITKNLILLEDHLVHEEKFCEDCIRKHLMTIEAFAEEACTLDPSGKWVGECDKMSKRSRRWMVKFTDKEDPIKLAQEIRSLRKNLVNRGLYDPRLSK